MSFRSFFSFVHSTALVATLLLLGACTSSYKSDIGFNPLEPIRVVVLPFAQVDKEDKVVMADRSLAIDQVTLLSSTREDSPEEITRKAVQQSLSQTNLDIVTPAVVEAELVHHGFALEDLTLDTAKIFATSPSQICSHILACDAVLYGRILDWSRNYFGIQSVNSVTLDLRLIGARDGKLLFRSQASDTESRGITKGPTGYSNLVLEPIKGLDNEIIASLSERMVQRMLAPLKADARPEFLRSAPPAIYAAAHDKPQGALAQRDRLIVLASGSPGQAASFSVGDVIQHIPMLERDPGSYLGEFIPLPSDSFTEQRVTVHHTDEFGRTTSQVLGNPPVTLR